jgi:hypothetical protein
MAEHVDDVTRALSGWIAAVTGLAIHPDDSEAEGIAVRLAQITPAARPRDAGQALIVTLRYRVTLRLADCYAAQRALGELVFAAIPHPRYEIATEESAGIPTVLITTSLHRERMPAAAPPVLHPLKVAATIKDDSTKVEAT